MSETVTYRVPAIHCAHCAASISEEVSEVEGVEDGALAMARSGTGQQCANRMNGLAAPANHTADIPASKLQLKDGSSPVRNLCQHDVVRKLNQLPYDKLEKLPHAVKANHESTFAQSYGATGKHE